MLHALETGGLLHTPCCAFRAAVKDLEHLRYWRASRASPVTYPLQQGMSRVCATALPQAFGFDPLPCSERFIGIKRIGGRSWGYL